MPKTKTKTKKRTVTGVNARDVTIANALGDAEYGPQVSAVQDLFRQAKRQYAGDVDAAKANAAATIAAVHSKREPTRDIYAEAKRSADNTASDIDASVASRLGTPSPVSNVFNASIARERGTQANRVSNERAGALNELTQREVGATAGRQLGINQARSEYGSTRDTLSQKLGDILGARGAKVAAAMGQLANKRDETSSKSAAAGAKINKYGISESEWQSMSQDARQKVIRDFAAGKGKKGKGPDWLPKGQAAAGLRQLPSLKSYADKAKAGGAFVAGHAGQPKLARNEAEKKIGENVAAPQHPVLLRAALDATYDGHISAYTVKSLIQAGYKPSEVARVLGVQTSGDYKRTHNPVKANTRAYAGQGNLGQSGHM
jgi:hypothetical protein